MTAELVEAGFAYLRAGLSIIALSGKAPNGAIHRHGLKEPFIVTDQSKFEAVSFDWSQACAHPATTGVGIVIPDHLCVVDIDGEEGAVALAGLIGSAVPDVPIARTANGLHLWFLSPHVVRSFPLAHKLDMRGSGSYVAAPPSLHPTGVRYTWLDPILRDGVMWVDWLPEPLEAIVTVRANPIPPARELVLPDANGGRSIEGLVKHLRGQEPGNRNAALYWAACCARDDGVALATALAELAPAAGLPIREAARTIQSAYGGKT
jgi:hypothetical protein